MVFGAPDATGDGSGHRFQDPVGRGWAGLEKPVESGLLDFQRFARRINRFHRKALHAGVVATARRLLAVHISSAAGLKNGQIIREGNYIGVSG